MGQRKNTAKKSAVKAKTERAKFCDIVLGQSGLATDERYNNNSKRLAARDEMIRRFDLNTICLPAQLELVHRVAGMAG